MERWRTVDETKKKLKIQKKGGINKGSAEQRQMRSRKRRNEGKLKNTHKKNRKKRKKTEEGQTGKPGDMSRGE